MRSAYALVVGIDVYTRPDIRPLTGAVADALRALAWLDSIKVPAENIFLHTGSPNTPNINPRINHSGVTRREIWKSMNTLSANTADQLFIFFSGHGFSIPGSGPIFLAGDYGEANDTNLNFDVEAFLEYFLTWRFKDQFFFYDACQTTIASIGQIPAVRPMPPAPPAGIAPIAPDTALTACFSASAGEAAGEDGYQGLMMRALLDVLDLGVIDALDPFSQIQEAIDYSWADGGRTLDLQKLFNRVVAQDVQNRATHQQNPYCQPLGRAQRENKSPILKLSPATVRALRLDLNRREAAPSVAEMTLRVRDPLCSLYLPPRAKPLEVPYAFCAPTNAELTVSCRLTPVAPWRLVSAPTNAAVSTLTSDDVVVELQTAAPPGPSPPEFNIKLIDGLGNPAPILGGRYEDIARKHGLSTSDAPHGVRFVPHEDGPDITFTAEQSGVASEMAREWRTAIQAEASRNDAFVIFSPPEETLEQSSPNTRVYLSPDWARHLAGYLGDSALVSFISEDPRSPPLQLSINALIENPMLRLPIGRARVEVEWPWGRAIRPLNIVAEGLNECALPETRAVLPLRNLATDDASIKRVEMDAGPVGSAFHFSFGDEGAQFVTARLEGVELLVRDDQVGWRLQPFSDSTLPEWDLLVSCTRIDSVSPSRLEALTEQLSRQPLSLAQGVFALAIAYSAYHQRQRDLLDKALALLPVSMRDCPDALLLSVAVQSNRPTEAIENLLKAVTEHRLATLMTWGLPLLERLFQRFERPSPQWLQQFAANSTWSVIRRSPENLR